MSSVILTFAGKGQGRENEPFYDPALPDVAFPHPGAELEISEDFLERAGAATTDPAEYAEDVCTRFNRGRFVPWLSFRYVEPDPTPPKPSNTRKDAADGAPDGDAGDSSPAASAPADPNAATGE